jgi:hypothetical protein
MHKSLRKTIICSKIEIKHKYQNNFNVLRKIMSKKLMSINNNKIKYIIEQKINIIFQNCQNETQIFTEKK